MENRISLSKSDLLLTADDTSTNNEVVLFLPGISGKAFSERFQPLVNLCTSLKLPIVRMSAWENEVEVQTKTWNFFHEAITEVIDHLLGLGYTKVITVGKSFGAGLLLSYQNKNITKKILWAPAVGVGEEDTFASYKDVLLSTIPTLLNIQISRNFIQNDQAKIYIIHGTKDTTIPIENSRMAVEAAKNGQIIEIENADHSFKSPEEEIQLMAATKSFLTSTD